MQVCGRSAVWVSGSRGPEFAQPNTAWEKCTLVCNSNTEAALSPQELAGVVVANARSGYDKLLVTGVRMNHPSLLFANKSEEAFIVCLQRNSSFIHLTIFSEDHAKGTRTFIYEETQSQLKWPCQGTSASLWENLGNPLWIRIMGCWDSPLMMTTKPSIFYIFVLFVVFACFVFGCTTQDVDIISPTSDGTGPFTILVVIFYSPQDLGFLVSWWHFFFLLK